MLMDDTLLDAVTRVIAAGGVRALSISAVADEAGISRVTLHRRGIAVDDLVVAVLARASDDLRASLLPVVTAGTDAATRLQAGLEMLCEVAERHAAVLTAFFAERPRPIPERPGRTTSFEFIELFDRLLRDGAIDGTLRVDDPTAQATLVANTVCWSYLHMRRAHGWPAEQVTPMVIALATAHLTRARPA